MIRCSIVDKKKKLIFNRDIRISMIISLNLDDCYYNMTKNAIKRILVPLDGSKNSFRGLDEAIIVAINCHASLTGLYVTPLSPPASNAQKAYIKNYLLKRASKFMEKAYSRCAQNGIVFFENMLYGDEGPKIVKFAHDRKFDLIVVGSRGMGSLKEMFLGSISNYVVHKAKILVLIVK